MKMLKIGFIGGGKMAQALAKGFITAGLTKGENLIASCHPSDKQSVEAFKGIGGQSTFDNVEVVKNSEIVLISVKPQILPIALKDITKSFDKLDSLFLSIAMGVTVQQLERDLPVKTRVIRVMPNITAMVSSGASVYCPGRHATKEDSSITQKLLKSVGTCELIPEYLFDAVTGLSGSGPAYVFVMIEALADGGVKMGIPRDLAYRLAAQTVLGAGLMVRSSNSHPALLKDDVTSPGGTTAAGLHYLEKKGFRAALLGAVEAAAIKATETANKS